MVDGDEVNAQRLRNEFPGWAITRERNNEGRPNWWKARRLRELSSFEDSKGLARVVYGTTSHRLGDALAAETEREAQLAADPASMPEIARTTISRDATQIGKAREWLHDLLGRNRPGVYDALVCLSELLTNSRIHTATENIRIAVFASHCAARVEVTDDGATALVPQLCHHLGVASIHGRGLAIVHALTNEQWGTRAADGGGRTTWFTVALR